MKKFLHDFKEFALKGNVIDMAVGVIIGSAFGKIVTSIVNDIITPLISLAIGRINLTDLKWVISPAELNSAGEVVNPEVAMTWGNFLQSVIDFLIIALCIFTILRIIMNTKNKLESLTKKKAEEEKTAEEEKAPEETELSLLRDIRDMLAKSDSDTENK